MWCMSGVAGTPGMDSPSAPNSTGSPSRHTPAITADSSSASNCERRMPASSSAMSSSDRHSPSCSAVPVGHADTGADDSEDVGVGEGGGAPVHPATMSVVPTTASIPLKRMGAAYRQSRR